MSARRRTSLCHLARDSLASQRLSKGQEVLRTRRPCSRLRQGSHLPPASGQRVDVVIPHATKKVSRCNLNGLAPAGTGKMRGDLDDKAKGNDVASTEQLVVSSSLRTRSN